MRTQGCGALTPQPVGKTGKRANSPRRRGTDSTPHTGTCSVGVELPEYIQEQDGGPTETVSEAPGAYGSCSSSCAAGTGSYKTASTLTPCPRTEVGVAMRHSPGPSHTSLPPNLHPPWSDLAFLRAGVPLEQVSRHAVVYMDGHTVSGVWTCPQLHWHINNTATIAYINRQGGLCSCRISQLTRYLLLWSQKHLRLLRAIHIPGLHNRAADELSRAVLPGEWRLHPQTVQLIWRCFRAAQVDMFASPETSHCQLFYSLTEGTLSTDALAHSWPRCLHKYVFPQVSLASSGSTRSRPCLWRLTGLLRPGSRN